MRELVDGFDPSPEPLRPMGQAHRGVHARWPISLFTNQTSGLGSIAQIKNSYLSVGGLNGTLCEMVNPPDSNSFQGDVASHPVLITSSRGKINV